MKKQAFILILALALFAGKVTAVDCNLYNVGGGGSYCAGGPGVSITLDNSQTGVTYVLFRDGNPTAATLAGTGSALTFSGVQIAGTYTIRGTADDLSCSETIMTGNATVTVNALPVATATSSSPVCEGNALNLTGGPGSMTPYAWTGPDGFTSTSQSPTITNMTSAKAGTYSLTVTDGNGCISIAATTAVVVNPLPGSIAGTTDVCVGSNTPLSDATAGGSWYSSSPSIASVVASTGVVTGNAAGTCVISYVLPVTGCYATTIVTVNPASVGGSVIPASTTVCTGTNSTVLTLSGNTGNVVKWQYSLDNFATAGVDIANTTSAYTATNLSATTYYIAVVQSGVCITANSSVATITVNAASVGGSVGTSTTVCSGSNNTALNLTGNNGNVVKWQYSTDNWLTSGDIPIITSTYSADNLTTTTKYRAVVQNGVCPSANSGDATVTVDPPSVGGTIAGSTDVCSGINSTLLTLSGNTGNIVKWQYYTDDWHDIVNSASTYTATNLSETTKYRAVIQSGICSSVNSAEAIITYYPASFGGTTASDQTICSGTLPADINLTGNIGIIVKWQKSSVFAFSLPTDIAITSATLAGTDIGMLTADTYFRAVVKSGTCSVDYSSVTTIIVRPTPTASISVSAPSTVCKNATEPVITFTNNSALPVRITYSINGTNQVPIDATTTATFNAPTNISGTFIYSLVSVAYQSGATCSNLITGSVIVTINPLPVPSIAGPATPRVTSTGNVYTTESGKDNYLWTFSGGGTKTGGGSLLSNTITITWDTEGARWVKVNYDNNPSGCTATTATQYDVVVKPLPSVSNVTVYGSPEIDKLLVGSYTYTDGAGFEEGSSTYKYKWYRNISTEITGANSITYTPVLADEGYTLSFEVTPVSTDGTSGDPVKSSPTSIVISSGVPVASQVCINGKRAVGETLTGRYKYTYAPKEEGTSSFRWLNNGLPISGADDSTYVLGASDIADNVLITFEVTPISKHPEITGFPVVSYPLARFTMADASFSAAIDTVKLEADPSGGNFSGSGVNNGIFSPKAVGYENSPYKIDYKVSIVNSDASCSQTASKELTVTEAGTYFDFDKNAVICHDASPITIAIKGIPPGARIYNGYGFFFNWDIYREYDYYYDYTYYYYGEGVTDPRIVSQTPSAGVYGELYGCLPYVDDNETPWTVTIDPSKLSPGNGNNVLKVYYIYEYYGYLLELPLNVESNVSVSRINNLNTKYCADDPIQDISVDVLYPTGAEAIWTGGAILSDLNQPVAKLNPKSGTPGQEYPISYTYSSANGCLSNVLRDTVTINPLPDPSFTLNPFYNIDSGAVTLIPILPPGGSFAGNGVSANKLFPDLAGTGSDIITYSIKDANLCYSELTKTTIIRKAQGTITGLPSVVCYRDTTFSVTATGLPSGVSVLDFTNKKNTIVHTPLAKNADYSILAAGAGIDTLIFSYKWDGVDYAISTVVNVDSIGQVVIKNLLPGDIVCANLAPFELFTSPSGGVFTGPVSGGYLDPSKAIGATSVSYKYISLKTGCSGTTVVPFKISLASEVSFVPADVCVVSPSDTTFFTNNTVSSDTVKSWTWEFSEPGGSKTSNIKEPGYLYTTGSFHTVTLTATTVNNCISSKTMTIDLGVKPIADFYWKNECYHSNDSIMLFDSTYSTSPIVSQTWNFFDGGSVITEQNPKYPKNLPGDLKVQHIVKTSYANCADTITRNIYIRPTITLGTDNYFENFESGNGGWVKGDETVNNWAFGNPNRDIINTAASGDHAWFTSYNVLAQSKESSSVISPCFDFTNSERPMVRLKLWRRFEMNRDGAALQYKIKEGPWQYVGTLDDGINWFNSTLIKGRPGGDQIGWTTIGSPDSEWTEARHTLDELIGNKDVKFRISYGSDGTSQNNDGIAFDDILVGERTRNVLLEHFENSSDIKSSAATAMVNTIAKSSSKDVINIQYHTNFPGTDPYYNDNPGDASARVLFYGLIKVPYSFVDGGNNSQEFAKMYEYVIAKIDSNDIRKRSLINPRFDISLTKTISGSILNVSVKLTALEAVDAENLTLYLAVTEKKNNVYVGAAGDTVFYNIFRKFIPDAGGINLKKNWSRGDSIVISDQSWVIEKIKNSSDIEIVAFIQNNVTKELYQADSEIETNITVGIEKLFGGKGNDFALYPNPAVNKITIAFKEPLNHDSEIRIYDLQGIVVALYKAGSGLSEFTIEKPGLRGGIYLVRVSAGSIDLGFRKLIISGD